MGHFYLENWYLYRSTFKFLQWHNPTKTNLDYPPPPRSMTQFHFHNALIPSMIKFYIQYGLPHKTKKIIHFGKMLHISFASSK